MDFKVLYDLCDKDSRMIGAIQKLEQYEDNPIAKMIPCWSWVEKSDIDQQIQHIMSECKEAEKETDMDKKALEVWDILQGCITAIAILEQKYGVDIAELVKRGIYKNAVRGYYNK